MDRTIGKSQNRNYDGERLMISLLEIAQSMNEADDDKYVSIGFGRFKLKGKEDDDDADVYAKTDSGKYVKSADQKSDDDGGKKPEEPQGGKLGGGDFDRDGDDESDMDDEDDDKNASEKENEQIEKKLQNIAKDKGLTVGSEDANHGGEIHGLVGKDDDPDNVLGFHAAPNFDDDGNMTGEPQYAIELGMGSSPMYFGSKEEADAALEKVVDDEKIRKAMDGEGDETLFDLGDHAKSIVKGKDEKIKVIDGKKYKAIKESKKNPRILKEIYERTFRSLK
jgi:hypothetical protein